MNDQQRRAKSEGADARTQLLDATTQLLSNAGATKLTSRSIAEAANVNLGAITYYFGSKQNLLDEAMLNLARTLLEPVLEELESDTEPIPKLLRSVQLLNSILAENDTVVGAYLRTVTDAATGGRLRSPLGELMTNVESLLAKEMTAQKDAAGLPDWVDPTAMAQLIVAVVHGTLLSSSLSGERIDPARIASQFAQLLLAVRTDTPSLQ